MQTAYNAIFIYLSTMFALSAVLKILNLKSFVDLVLAYEVLPRILSMAYGAFLPFIEFAVAIGLLIEQTQKYSIIILMFMLFSFSFAVIKVLITKKVITCGCYGKFMDSKADIFTVVKLSILIILAILLFLRDGMYSLQVTTESVVIGVFINVALLIVQGIWLTYQKRSIVLKNMN